MILSTRKKHCFVWRSRNLCPLVLLIRVALRWRRVWNTGRMTMTRVKPKYSEKNQSQCQFVYHKSHRKWPRIEGVYEGWNFKSGNYLFTTDTK